MTIRRKAFTLVEMLIVTGIIILLMAMAIPAIRSLSGTRSISLSYNILSGVITKAREQAISLQQPAGVLFYFDQNSGRVVCLLVQAAQIQDTGNIINAANGSIAQAPNSNFIALDAIPNMDSIMLPIGVGIQTVFNGMNVTLPASLSALPPGTPPTTPTEASYSAIEMDDRYLGFNTVSDGDNQIHNVGGCILFDGNGKLVQRPYGLQFVAPNSTFNASQAVSPTNPQTVASNLAKAVFGSSSLGNTSAFGPNTFYEGTTSSGPYTSNILIPGTTAKYPIPSAPLLSQIAFVLFDHDTFKALGFSDGDPSIGSNSGGGPDAAYAAPSPAGANGGDGLHSEKDEETWLDANSTPIMINRFNGTLIRGE